MIAARFEYTCAAETEQSLAFAFLYSPATLIALGRITGAEQLARQLLAHDSAETRLLCTFTLLGGPTGQSPTGESQWSSAQQGAGE